MTGELVNTGDSAFVTNFVVVVLLLAVDFWTVRIAGRKWPPAHNSRVLETGRAAVDAAVIVMRASPVWSSSY